MSKKVNVAILGASGYTGAEAMRLLAVHPGVEIVALSAERNAGKEVMEVFPHLSVFDLPKIVGSKEINWKDIDAVFCCLPHGVLQQEIANIPTHVRIIDVSADFRIKDAGEYAKWYGHDHHAPDLLVEAVYGLTEVNREEIKGARLVACPGCYPTSILLPLIPLLTEGLIESSGIISDSKSGISGAGRAAKEANLFTEINEGMFAYGIAGHRHLGEIEQELSLALGEAVNITFTPHVAPMNRGILSTIYVNMKGGAGANDLRCTLMDKYKGEPFVHVMPEGVAPATQRVRGSNHAAIGVFADRIKGRAIIVSAIDNLVKGASGQAVQNFNLLFGFDEAEGLRQGPIGI